MRKYSLLIFLLLFSRAFGVNNAERVQNYLNCLHSPISGDQEQLNQLQPSQLGSLSLVEEATAVQVRTALSHRMALLHGLDCRYVAPHDKKGGCTWTEYFEQYVYQGNFHHEPQYNAFDRAVIIGIDYQPIPDLYLGGIGSYSHSHMHWHDSRGHASINSYYGGIYTTWSQDLGYIEGSFMGASNSFNATRRIHFDTPPNNAKDDHHGYTLITSLCGGLTFHFSRLWENKSKVISEVSNHTLVQFLTRLDYVYIHENSFKEHGTPPFDLRVRDKNSDLLRSELGIKLTFCEVFHYGRLVPDFKLSYVNESRFGHTHYRSRFRDASSSSCLLNSRFRPPQRNLLNPEIGFTLFLFNEMLVFSLFYESEVGRSYMQQEGSLQFEYRF